MRCSAAFVLLPLWSLACATTAAGPADVELVRCALRHVAASEIAPLLTEVLEPRIRIRRDRAVETQQAQATASRATLRCTVDAATNCVLLSGPPDQVQEALELIARLDTPEMAASFAH